MKKMRIYGLLLLGMMMATIENAKATMCGSDMNVVRHITQYDEGISMCEKGGSWKKEKQVSGIQESLTSVRVQKESMASAAVKTPSWTRYILVTLMGLFLIKYGIAEAARRKCNRLVRDTIMYYTYFKTDPDSARRFFNRYYKEELSAMEYLTVFQYKQFIKDSQDLKFMKIVNEEIDATNGCRKYIQKMDFKGTISKLQVA